MLEDGLRFPGTHPVKTDPLTSAAASRCTLRGEQRMLRSGGDDKVFIDTISVYMDKKERPQGPLATAHCLSLGGAKP